MPKKRREHFTIRMLIEHLEKIEKEHGSDLAVGRGGHFGEFNPMDEGDFYARPYNGHFPYDTYKGDSWRSGKHFPIDILEIIGVDLGPDPD